MGGFKKGKMAGTAMVSPFEIVLNSLKFRLLPKNRPREWRVHWKFLACIRWYLGRWFDDSRVLLVEGSNKNNNESIQHIIYVRFSCSWLRRPHIAERFLDLCGLTPMTFWTPPNFWFGRGYKKDRLDLTHKASQGTNKLGQEMWRKAIPLGRLWGLPELSEREGVRRILLLCTHKRKPVFGADAQRISRPSYTAVVRTNGYLRFSFWGGKALCAFDCKYLM
jgi:hypothetical protein